MPRRFCLSLIVAAVLPVLWCSTATAQASRDCVPNSAAPGGCDSTGPGGKPIGRGEGPSIAPGGAPPSAGQSIPPAGGQALDPDRSKGLDPNTLRPRPMLGQPPR